MYRTHAITLPADTVETGSLWVRVFGCWFILQIFFNDVGNLFNIPIGFNLRPDRLFLAAVLAVVFTRRRAHGDVRVRIHPAEWSLILLFVWGLISLVIAGTIHHPENRHLSTLISWFGLPLLTLWCVRRSHPSQAEITALLRILIAIGVYLAVTAAFEHYEVWTLVFPGYIADPRVGIHYGRARGPFGNAAVLGGVLTVIYLVIVFYMYNVRPYLTHKVLLVLIAIAIYFTYTRSGWVSLIVSLASLGLYGGRMRRHLRSVLLLGLLLFASGALSKFSLSGGTLFTGRQETVGDRENIMRASIRMIQERPIFGFGYGTFMSRNYDYFDSEGLISAAEGNHNVLSGLVVELGAVGFALYAMSWWFLLRDSLRLARDSDPRRTFVSQLGALSFASITGYLVGAQFFDPRFFALFNCLVMLLAGFACNATDEARPRLP